ncbi:MAG: MerR family transcriptional regulator [Acidobacteriota bacterium]|nr:MerR family transcriptional regulator [Acidobacteriota bacterium]
MTLLTISETARRVGLRPSAIRYYEQLGILPLTQRVSGQRRYNMSGVYRIAVLRTAQEAGFSLDEIRELLLGLGQRSPISARWKKAAVGKIAELDARIDQIRSMKELLQKLQSGCHCETVDQCGAGILGHGCIL